MKKTTLYLPEELKEAISLKARSESRSEAEIIRRALEEATAGFVPLAAMPRIPEWEGDGTVASRVDEVLSEGFGNQ